MLVCAQDLLRGSSNMCGKVRSNFVGTEFTVFDAGMRAATGTKGQLTWPQNTDSVFLEQAVRSTAQRHIRSKAGVKKWSRRNLPYMRFQSSHSSVLLAASFSNITAGHSSAQTVGPIPAKAHRIYIMKLAWEMLPDCRLHWILPR